MTKTEVPLTIRRGKNSSVCDFSKQLREKKKDFCLYSTTEAL